MLSVVSMIINCFLKKWFYSFISLYEYHCTNVGALWLAYMVVYYEEVYVVDTFIHTFYLHQFINTEHHNALYYMLVCIIKSIFYICFFVLGKNYSIHKTIE